MHATFKSKAYFALLMNYTCHSFPYRIMEPEDHGLLWIVVAGRILNPVGHLYIKTGRLNLGTLWNRNRVLSVPSVIRHLKPENTSERTIKSIPVKLKETALFVERLSHLGAVCLYINRMYTKKERRKG